MASCLVLARRAQLAAPGDDLRLMLTEGPLRPQLLPSPSSRALTAHASGLAQASGQPESEPFPQIMARLARSVDRGDALISQVTSGAVRGLDSGALLTLQVGIYRHSEALDLVSKGIERVLGSVRTLYQSGG